MKEITRKVYVNVNADFHPDGQMVPRQILWDDGRKYEIDRVTDCRRAASLKAGGAGIRYTCQIGGKSCFLYYEENYKWFVEARSYVEVDTIGKHGTENDTLESA